jgi:N-carbamoylputrescine amidase
MKSIKLAMIQLNNYYKDQSLGYIKAQSFISKAAAQGAQLAVLPELFACGYIPNQTIWNYAEPANGKTAQWACKLSKELGIYIGAGFTETDGKDFYNAYLISNPQGKISKIIRKEDAEAYCFKRGPGELFIDTDLGRIGIGICVDNHYAERLFKMKAANIDFMLMPHAAPSPYKTGSQITEDDIVRFNNFPYLVASAYSNYLRVPSIYVNPVGTYPEFMGGFGVKSFNEDFQLMGGSIITNASGDMITKMDTKEGYITASITPGKTDQEPEKPVIYHQKWLHPGNAIYRYLILPGVIRKGIRSYNKERVKYLQQNKKD